MIYQNATRVLAALLVVALVAPPLALMAPQRTQAASGAISCLLGLGSGAAGSAASMIGVPVQNLTIQMQTSITGGATTGSCIYEAILVPIAKLIARMILQKITASIIKFINGNNGTGQPSFVPNLSVHLQAVGDASAIPFISKLTSAFNSPFGPAISAVMRQDYTQLTSLAGFYAANKYTLDRASPNANSFLAGNWSQGGPKAWFSLTTQVQNNPYTLFQAAAGQLSRNVGLVQTNRRQDLSQAGGFLSWCGGDTTASSKCVATTAGTCPAGCAPDDSAPTGCAPSTDGVKPSAPCTNPDGTPAKAVTPGSLIHDYSQKAIAAAGIEQLISVNDLDAALGAIVTALAAQVLGGVRGLLGASTPSSSGGGTSATIVTRLQSYSGGDEGTSPSAGSLADSTIAQVDTYTSSWRAIETAANAASMSLTGLINFCNEQKSNPELSLPAIEAQITSATATLTTIVQPVLAEALTIPASVAPTRALALKLKTESAGSTTPEVASQISTDISTLLTMPPAATTVAGVQQNASPSGGAQADPSGSLNVSGGNLIDRLNLISINATSLKPACTVRRSSGGGSGTGDGGG